MQLWDKEVWFLKDTENSVVLIKPEAVSQGVNR